MYEGPPAGATVAAARAPFVAEALHWAERLGTEEALSLAERINAGADTLEPERFYALSSKLQALHRASPAAEAEAQALVARAAEEERRRQRQADRAALAFARTTEGRTWL
jgi:hypothetical protein